MIRAEQKGNQDSKGSPRIHGSEESGNNIRLSRLGNDVYQRGVTGAVKMVRFSYSNEDTKDEEGRESWRPEMPLSRCYAPPR